MQPPAGDGKKEHTMFDPKYIDSQTFRDWPLHYDPLLPEKRVLPDGTEEALDTGVSYLPNGDVRFSVYAPGAGSVKASSKHFELELQKGDNGVFVGTLPFDPANIGPHSLDFIVDGAVLLSPYAPISWHRNRPVNYMDIPDPETPYIYLRDVPHGAVTRQIYPSKAMGRYERCLVYTPAGYMNGTQSYPVLYLQHGMTENEVTWEYNGRVSTILDNMIADGECPPFIVVMNNGMIRYNSGARFDTAFADNLLGDCMPFIEKTYRVKTGKENTAIAGLSMGSMQASIIGLSHPELFSWVGVFSGFLRAAYDDSPEGTAHLALLHDKARFEREISLLFRCIGDKDGHLPRFTADDALLAQLGVDAMPNCRRVVYPGQFHEFGAWRRALHDFARLIFK